MAQPYPPQGEQKQYNEKPLKVYAEQFNFLAYTTDRTLPVGATDEVFEPAFAQGQPRVYLTDTVHVLMDGEWVISSRYSGQVIEVISNEEFDERFGKGNTSGETTPA